MTCYVGRAGVKCALVCPHWHFITSNLGRLDQFNLYYEINIIIYMEIYLYGRYFEVQ
jgi:hypothetical protein